MDPNQLAEIAKEFGKHENDTGSSPVQIAILTYKVRELTEHLKRHPKDKHSMRGLVHMVNLRRSHQQYLMRTDRAKYHEVQSKLGLRG